MKNKNTALHKYLIFFLIVFLLVAFTANNVFPVAALVSDTSSNSRLQMPVQPQNVSLAPPQSPKTITVDDASLGYTGSWVHDSTTCSGAYNDTCSHANSSGAFSTYVFTGSQISVYSRTSNNRGKMNIYIDDAFMATVDLYTASFTNQKLVYSASLSNGEHTIKFAWTGTKNPASSDYKIFIDKITYYGDDNVVDNPEFTYTGTWSHDGACEGAYNNTCSHSSSSGAYATYTFTGSTMTIFARTSSNRGKMDVYLDNTLLSTVDLYSASVVEEKVVYSTSFSYGQHTVKLAYTGTKNASSSGYMVFIDKMIYTNELVVVDDLDFTLSGSWAADPLCEGAYGSSCSRTNSSTGDATYTFTGSALTLYSRTLYDRGNMNIYLDNNLIGTVDLYSEAIYNQKTVFSASFPYGQHTVKLSWAGTKNTNSSDYKVFIDKMTYYTAAPTPTPTFTPSNTPTTTFTPSNTPTATATFTPSNTPTATFTPSNTPTVTFTPSNTPTATFTPSNTPTATITPIPRLGGGGTCWDGADAWPDYTVYYDILTSSLPAGVTEANWLASIEASAQTWSNVTPSHFTFVRQAGSNNTVSYDFTQNQTILAGTVIWSDDTPEDPDSPDDPYYDHAYTKINPLKAPFDTNNPHASGAINIQELMIHEFGHWLRLDDLASGIGCSDSVMTGANRGDGTATAQYDLGPSDENGINYKYP